MISNNQQIAFSKFHGTGNDFVIIDDEKESFPIDCPKLIQGICQQHTGIGADGVILKQKSSRDDADFQMRIYNADGSEADMCGNGLSCLCAFAARQMKIHDKIFSIETKAGLMSAKSVGDEITLEWELPKILKHPLEKIHSEGGTESLYGILIDSGERHGVFFVEDLKCLDVNGLGKYLRHHPEMGTLGANINFAKIEPDQTISVRTYEKGVEQETLACGTGAMAVAFAAHKLHQLASPIVISFGLGKMQVSFAQRAKIVNHASFVFSGQFDPADFIN